MDLIYIDKEKIRDSKFIMRKINDYIENVVFSDNYASQKYYELKKMLSLNDITNFKSVLESLKRVKNKMVYRAEDDENQNITANINFYKNNKIDCKGLTLLSLLILIKAKIKIPTLKIYICYGGDLEGIEHIWTECVYNYNHYDLDLCNTNFLESENEKSKYTILHQFEIILY